MDMADRTLLVEGEADKSFFEEFCKTLKLHTCVKVAPPKDVGGLRNGREGVFELIPELLKSAGLNVIRLAAVVDADSDVNGGGYQRTIAVSYTHLTLPTK